MILDEKPEGPENRFVLDDDLFQTANYQIHIWGGGEITKRTSSDSYIPPMA